MESLAAETQTGGQISDLEIQHERQSYLGSLRDSVLLKMEQLREEAERGSRSEKTFQQWLSDQICESQKYLELQFTEEVIARAWKTLQKDKLNKLKELLDPVVGRTDAIKAELRQSAEQILEPLNDVMSQLHNVFGQLQRQTRSLNQLCMRNGFLKNETKSAVIGIANCSTFTVGSLSNICGGEVNHISSIAQMYLQQNRETPKSEKIVLRNSRIYGGRSSHAVEVWPDPSFFRGNKTKRHLKDFRLARLDWSIGGSFIDSIRFTMSDGEKSPKYGSRIPTNYCDFESRITKIKVRIASNRLVGLTFYTESDGEFLTIGDAPHTSTAEMDQLSTEATVGFQMRMAQSALQGLGFTLLTSQEAIDARKAHHQDD